MSFPDKEGIVYAMTFPDGKKYVGVTTTGIHKRLINHAADSKSSDRKVSKAIRKYGIESIDIEVLDSFQTKEEAFKLEKHYIKELDSVSNGYNAAEGGLGATGVIPNEETRGKMSEAQKKRFEDEEQRKHLCEQFKKWTKENPDKYAESRAKAIESLRSIENRERNRATTIRRFEENPEYGEKHSEFMFHRYQDNPNLRLEVSRAKGGTPIEILKDGEVLARYDMAKDCAKDYGLSAGNVYSVLNGNRAHTKGYTFRRVLDSQESGEQL